MEVLLDGSGVNAGADGAIAKAKPEQIHRPGLAVGSQVGQQPPKFQQGTVEAVDQHQGGRARALADIGAGDGLRTKGDGDRRHLHLGHHPLGRSFTEGFRQSQHLGREPRGG